jgi:hypothetical protein
MGLRTNRTGDLQSNGFGKEHQVKKLSTASFWATLLFLPVLASGQANPVLVLKTRIALPMVDGRMDHLGVDLKGQRLFATAIDNHTVEVVDLRTGRQVRTIGDLNRPQAVYYDPPQTNSSYPAEATAQ